MQEVNKGKYCKLCGQLFWKENFGTYEFANDYESIKETGLCLECFEYEIEKAELESRISEI